MSRRPRRPAAVGSAVAAALLAGASGCSGTVSVVPAPDAADPACARVITALPERVAGLERRSTTAQASAAWGDPAVVLRCGVTPPGPTTTDCTVLQAPGGPAVDWLTPDPRGGRAVWTTYGRVPAVELSMPDDPDVTSAAPQDVAAAVALAPQQRECTPG